MAQLLSRFKSKKFYFYSYSQRLCYRIYESQHIKNNQKLILLHGAGVAGVDTWANIVNFLEHWQYILVPDFRGMGETFSLADLEKMKAPNTEDKIVFNAHDIDNEGYDVFELVKDMHQLVKYLNWDDFDLAGYSLGGLVAMLYKQAYSNQVKQQFLLEPGLLDRLKWNDTKELRLSYSKSVESLRNSCAREGVITFLNTISPNRKNTSSTEELAIKRLAYRHLGFANALESVNMAIHTINRNQLVKDQGKTDSLVGSLSVSSMHNYHQSLSNEFEHWQYHKIIGTDHALPYQKPRQIARLFNSVKSS